MKQNFAFVLLIFVLSLNLVAQTNHQDLIDKAQQILSDSIGVEVLDYLTIHQGSYYEYINKKGRTEKQLINKSRKIRENIVGEVNILFALYDSSLTKRGVHLELWVKLDSNFNFLEFTNLEEIPKPYLNGDRPNWLPLNQIDSIIGNLPFRHSEYPPDKRFYYNTQAGKYHWKISKWIRVVEYKNEIYEDVYDLDSYTGEVLDFSQDTSFVIINKGIK